MNNVLGMQEGERLGQIGDHVRGVAFGELHTLCDRIKQVSTLQQCATSFIKALVLHRHATPFQAYFTRFNTLHLYSTSHICYTFFNITHSLSTRHVLFNISNSHSFSFRQHLFAQHAQTVSATPYINSHLP